MVRGIKRDADEEHHDRQEDDAREKVHGPRVYLFDLCGARLGDAAINQRVGFPLVGVEISQPTKVISVTTMIPSQNLR